MSSSVNGSTIILTRGDSFISDLMIVDSSDEIYIPTPEETIRFEMRRYKSNRDPIFTMDIPIRESLRLEFKPEQTQNLPYGYYAYSIRLIKKNGDADTFITDGKILIQ
jgi:hypothetical protein